MKRRFFSREARRRFKYYRSMIAIDMATGRNPRTGAFRAHEAGKSMLYLLTHRDTWREADRRAREMVVADIHLAWLNDWSLRETPRTEWAQNPPNFVPFTQTESN